MLKESDVTIIVPHYGASNEQCYALNHCVTSLKETFNGRIIVVKNGKTDHFCMCRRDIDLIEDQGQCKAVNAAVAITNTPWIIVTNDDMMYAPKWFDRLIEAADYPKNQCISPMLIEPQGGASTFQTVFCGGAGGDFNKEKWLETAKSYMEKTAYFPLEVKTGFNLPFLTTRVLWDLVGGYDINFDPWGSNSDSDLEYKIKLAGVQPMQNRNSVVYHFSQTSGTFEPRNSSYWQRNFAYFKEKWGFERTDQGIWEASFDIPDKERIYRPWWEKFYNKI